jgi:diguanylate cyclase (GGDEF)-like protein/PAS domain S-box-containing protein
MLCSILLLDEEGKHLVKGTSPSLPDFYNEAINGMEIGIGAGSCGTAAFTGKRVIVEDIATHPYWTPFKELGARAGLAACWSQPILSSLNQILGTFAIYHREAHVPVASDIRLIEQSARLASLAIERKQAEIDLIRSELKFHTLYDSTSDAVLMLTEQGFFDCNKAAVKLFGCATREELCSYHPGDLSPPMQMCGTDSLVLAKQYITTAMKNDVLNFEWLHKRIDTGQTFIAEVLLSTMFLDGELVLHVAVRDITLRKQNEIELRIAATAFESQEGMLVTDANYNILRVNHSFTNITGYTAEEVIGKNPRIFQSGQQDADFYATMWKSINSTGFWQGEVWNRRKSGEIFPEHLTITAVKDQNSITSNYVATYTDITLRKEAVDKIEQLAFYDPLTGLPNRRLLQDRLKTALASSHRNGRKGALLFIDMDNFKVLNDTFGHDMGDLLLQQVAQRLELCVREGDTVARLGGDEFVVMLEDLSEQPLDTATQTKIIGNKIMAILNQPYQLDTHEYHNTPSIGATLFNGHEQSSEELLKQADIAMYQAKASGRNALRFFDPQMQATINARVSLEHDLRLGLKKQQFILYYQPQVHHSGQIIGAEVLIRWQHPLRGLVSPVDFIPIAEESHLILLIGEWVLETACVQLKIWEGNEHTRHLQLAVNVSSRQFYQADFVGQVTQILSQHAINPNNLKLELTESLVLDDIDGTIFKMNALRKIGVRFSMDDFGTGYSSLSSLKKLPLDQLKIDQSFVRDISIDLDDTIIVETIIAMANKLNMEVIAEGVETETQRAFLERHDCQLFQGYLFSKPVPIEQFELLLKKNSL